MRRTGYDTLGEYSFGKKLCTHKFCKTCGSSILIDFNGAFAGGKDAGKDIEPSKDTVATNVSVCLLSRALPVSNSLVLSVGTGQILQGCRSQQIRVHLLRWGKPDLGGTKSCCKVCRSCEGEGDEWSLTEAACMEKRWLRYPTLLSKPD